MEADFQVFADENMLRTILRNLLMNALKFTDSGGEVRIDCFREDDHVRISVVDSGVGMDAEVLGKLQNSQGYSASGTKGEKGSGLGLLLRSEERRVGKECRSGWVGE